MFPIHPVFTRGRRQFGGFFIWYNRSMKKISFKNLVWKENITFRRLSISMSRALARHAEKR